ncbi:UNVERIFIED_CONTAM: hypothetical protein Slati_4471600 [Sesamum latifolium]|uniref:DUF4283 domain-containing protein n=1 Tax=Sesamum latifolium TaxID=2727402 RepID=A0AAW2SRJ3_9LAMI
MEEVIKGGPWLFQGQPIILQRWEPGMALRKHKHTEVPILIKLRHLPVEYWTNEGLSIVASVIGKPLYPDAITKACTRLNFARTTCSTKRVEGKARVEVYVKRTVPNSEPVTISTVPMTGPSTVGADETIVEPRLEKVAKMVAFDSRLAGALIIPSMKMMERKGKEIILYNPFDILMNDDELADKKMALIHVALRWVLNDES